MNKTQTDQLPELIVSDGSQQISKQINQLLKNNGCRKIAAKIYTTNTKESLAVITRRHLFHILETLYPGAVISHRSALEGGLASDNSIVLSYKYTKKRCLSGVTIRCIKGPPAQAGDTAFIGELFIASRDVLCLKIAA